MGIQTLWDDDEKTIVRYEYSPGWTWDDFFIAVEQGKKLTLSVPHRVDYIANFNGTSSPQGGSAMGNTKIAIRNRAPNGHMIVTVNNMFMTMMLNLFKSLDKDLGKYLHGVTSLEEARAYIRRIREQERERA